MTFRRSLWNFSWCGEQASGAWPTRMMKAGGEELLTMQNSGASRYLKSQRVEQKMEPAFDENFSGRRMLFFVEVLTGRHFLLF
jgi:hypothetical protein